MILPGWLYLHYQRYDDDYLKTLTHDVFLCNTGMGGLYSMFSHLFWKKIDAKIELINTFSATLTELSSFVRHTVSVTEYDIISSQSAKPINIINVENVMCLYCRQTHRLQTNCAVQWNSPDLQMQMNYLISVRSCSAHTGPFGFIKPSCYRTACTVKS